MAKTTLMRQEAAESLDNTRALESASTSRAAEKVYTKRSKAIKQEDIKQEDSESRDASPCPKGGMKTEAASKISPSAAFKDSLQRFHYSEPASPIRSLRSSTKSPIKTQPTCLTPAAREQTQHLISPTPYPTPSSPPATVSTAGKKRKRQTSVPTEPPPHPPIPDLLAPNLLTIFLGSNPGLLTAKTTHHYAHPSNLFYKLLHTSNCTDRRLLPIEDSLLPTLYSLGSTNLVSRATKDVAGLEKGEMERGVGVLEDKVRKWRPESVCIVGKGIWEAVWRVKHGRGFRKGEFCWGWQDEGESLGRGRGGRSSEEGPKREEEQRGDEGGRREDDDDWEGARIFVTCSTSGLSASLRPAEKEAIWKPFGEWVVQRRAERSMDAGAVADDVKSEACLPR